MKVAPQHFETMRQAIAPLDTEQTRNAYRAGEYARADLTRDVDKRYRWDLFYAASKNDRPAFEGVSDAGYLHSHLDTALRMIVPSL